MPRGFAALAEASERLVPSDIKFITAEAARMAHHQDMMICQATVMEMLEKYYPNLESSAESSEL